MVNIFKPTSTYKLIAVGIIAGFWAGFGVAIHKIIISRYIDYKLFRLAGYSLQESLNKYTAIGIAISLVLIAILIVLQRIVKKVGGLYGERFFIFFQKISKFFPAKLPAILAILLIIFLLNVNLVMTFQRGDLDQPNIILISIDDLRADHLGCYGYGRNTSPNIDTFAADSILFERCYVHQPWTLTSHMSMLTSLYPMTHGVNIYKGIILDPAFVTLAEILKNEGFFTMGFASGGVYMAPQLGFEQGFDFYYISQNYGQEDQSRTADSQNIFIKNYLRKHASKRFLLFIHYFDVHSDQTKLPYDAPPPYDSLFSGRYKGVFEWGFDDIVASKYLKHINDKQIKQGEKVLGRVIALYDNGIAYMDKCLGDLFATLKEHQVFDNSLIIVTSDHGEEFQEHGYMLHSNPYCYEELVRVPLIIKLPKKMQSLFGYNGKRVQGLVESIDIMPSILDLCGVSHPEVEGRSFKGMIFGNKKGKDYVYGLNLYGSSYIRSNQWKMLISEGFKEEGLRLFDLLSDPFEKDNQIVKNSEIKNALKAELQKKIELSQKLRSEILGIDKKSRIITFSSDKNKIITEEEKQRLEALGYVE